MILRVEGLEMVYNNVILALNGISFEIQEGAIVALLGGNGAGKTSTLRCISNVLKSVDGEIKRGTILFDGQEIRGKEPAEIIRRGIVSVPEGRRVFADLTVEENIKIGAYCRSNKKEIQKDYEKVLNLFPPLANRLKVRAGYLSGGEQQMLAIGRAMMAKPRLLMLDEPSMGLSPLIVKNIFETIREINKAGTTILLVEQNANIALQNASYAYIMENGKVVLDDPCEKLMKNEDVQEFYLGISTSGSRKNYREVKSYKRRKRWLA